MSALKRILIVDDERPLAHALDLKLQHEGFETAVATNGKEALALVDSQHFDVMLLDMMMPEMDGFQVLQQLQGRAEKPIIIVLSNLSLHIDEARVMEAGAKKYFVKSDTPLSTIVETVKEYLKT